MPTGMSALGHKRTFSDIQTYVRFTPEGVQSEQRKGMSVRAKSDIDTSLPLSQREKFSRPELPLPVLYCSALPLSVTASRNSVTCLFMNSTSAALAGDAANDPAVTG